VDQGPDLIRDLLILEGRAATGQLEVASEGVHTLLYFVEGQLVYAEGGTLSDTLGRVLTREGTLTREQYVEVLQQMTDALVEHEEMRFGEVAIRLGYLSPQQVTEGLVRQVRSRLLGSLQHERSARYFDEGSSYTGRVPRFPVEIGPAILAGLHAFYDEERLYPLLMLSLERRWRLRNPADLGSARFAFTRDDLQVVRRLKEPTRLADLLGEPPTAASMRVALLLWLAGLVEDVEPRTVEADRPLSERPPLERPLEEDLVDRTLPSLRPPAFAAPEPEVAPIERASSEPLTPSSKAIATELASARARVLKGLAGASGGARPAAPSRAGAVDAIAALRERQKVAAPAAPRPSTGDPRVEAETYFQRGRVDLEQGRTAAARQQFETAYAGHPSDEYGLYVAWARFLTADSASVAEQRESVEIRMMDCLRADRRMAFAHYIAGRLALIDEEFEAAEKSFKRAISFDGNLTDAARSLRLVQQRLGAKK
jgi:hypothetical protein